MNRKLNPLFFAAVCAAILLFAVTANAVIQQIGNESDQNVAAWSGPIRR